MVVPRPSDQESAVDVVGRRLELDAIAGAVQEGVGGPCQVVLLEGEAGIGKSTLLRAARGAAERAGATVVAGGITAAESSLGWAGLATIVQSLPAATMGSLAPGQRAVLEAATGRAVDGAADPMAVAGALGAALGAAAATAPLVLLVDDVHWLDHASAGALAFAVRAVGRDRVTAVFATRPGPRPLEPERLVPPERFRLVAPAGLTPAGVHRLLRDRFGLVLRRPDLIRLHAASAGNPLHAIEAGRLLASGRSIDAALLPPSLQAVIGEHLAALEPATTEVLRSAALLATPTIGVLERLHGVAATEQALVDAERHAVIDLDGDTVRFRHPLLPAGVLDSLGTVARRRLERRLAEVVDDPEARALHLAAAATTADAATALAVERAADAALARGATVEAAARYRRAVDLTPPDDPDARRRRLTAAGRAVQDAGDHRGALELFREALAAATDEVERIELRRNELVAVAHTDGPVAARPFAQQLALDAVVAPRQRPWVLRMLSRLSLFAGEFDAARHDADEALAAARALGDDDEVLASAASVALAGYLCGDPVDVDAFEAAVGAWDVQVSGHTAAGVLGELLVWSDRLERALEVNGAHVRHAEAAGDLLQTLNALSQVSDAQLRAGAWDDAVATIERYVELVTTAGEQPEGSPLLGDLAYLEAARGRAEAATARIAALDRHQDRWAPIEVVQCRARAGFVALAGGDHRAAARAFREALGTARAIGFSDATALPFRADAVEALVLEGSLAEAAHVADELDGIATRSGRPRARAEAARARALVAAARGELDEAEAGVTAALEAYDDVPVPLDRARTLLLAGVVSRRAGRRSEARERLQAARQVFEELGAVAFTARVDDELARLGDRPTASGVELTPTEQQIAELVAAGRTNVEVAAELFVSVRTVESNLTKVYRKLGVRSRTELAARMQGRGG